MSLWYEVKDIDDLDIDGEDLNILFNTDYNGNCYVTVPIALIKEVLKLK